MKECVLCKTRYQKGSGVTFHKFPTDSRRMELWLKMINKPSWHPNKYDYICSKHFFDDCFIKHNSCTTLKKCSIPTVFSISDDISSTHGNIVLPIPSTSGERIITPPPSVPETIAVGVKRTLVMDLNRTKLRGRKRRSTSCDSLLSIASKKARSETSSTHEKMVHPTPSVSGTRMVTPTPSVPDTIARGNIRHDHCYENTPKSSSKELLKVKNSLRISRDRVKVLSQHVKRLKVNVSSLRTVINELKKKNNWR